MTPENETKLRHAILQRLVDNKEAVLRSKLAEHLDPVMRGYIDRILQEQRALTEWLKLMDEK